MPSIFERLKFLMIAPRIKRRRGTPSTLMASGYTVVPLVPLSDDEIAYRAGDPLWTLTGALFLLSGYKPPGYESTRQIQDHFWPAYDRAWKAIKVGALCKEQEWAGERVFIDTPANWFAWADRIGPEHIKVDKRMRRALSQMADTPDGTVKEGARPVVSKSKAGAEDRDDGRPEYTPPYVAFMLQATQEMGLEPGTRILKKTIEAWLRDNWDGRLGEPTKRKIESMATSLRPPKDGRGGHFKSNHDE